MKVVATLSLSSTFNYHFLSCITFFIFYNNFCNFNCLVFVISILFYIF